MRQYLNSKIIQQAEKIDGGNKLFLEILKFLFVIWISQNLSGVIISTLNKCNILFFTSISQLQILFGIGLQGIVVILFCYIYENIKPNNLGISVKRMLHSTFKGYIIGFTLISLSCLILLLFGTLKYTKPTVSLDFAYLFALFFIYFFQAFGEEILYRGYFLISACRKNRLIWVILISSLIFSLHHRVNPGYNIVAALVLFFLGIILSLFMIKYNNIWVSTAIHSAWNFVQGNIYGINVSGTSQSVSILSLVKQENSSNLLHGGQMGLEGSIVSCLILLVLIIIIFIKRKAFFNSVNL